MSQHIPAWKRIGLKVREELSEDPLAITPHLESSNLTNKQAKKLNKQKRKLEENVVGESKEKKLPKRVKLPKSERAPPPEKDQLAYLRQYEVDKDNWKFSKQKQNWILKNIRNIPKDYESALESYLSGLQGGSRDRLVSTLNEVIEKWNVIAEETEKKIEEELRKDTEKNVKDDEITNLEGEGKEKSKDTEEKKKQEEKEKEKEKEKEEAPDYDYAVRCRNIIKLLTDEVVELKGIDFSSDLQEEHKKQTEEENSKIETKESKGDESKKINDEEEQKNVDSDNLIIDEVEVSGLVSEQNIEPMFQNSKESNSLSKKSSSSKKKKKAKK